MQIRSLRFTTAHHITIVLLIIAIQVTGLFLIFDEAQRQARDLQLDVIRSQVDASGRALDLFFSSVEDALRTSVVTDGDGTVNTEATLRVLSRRRLQPSIVARFVRTADQRAVLTTRNGPTISPDRIQDLVITAHRRNRNGYNLVLTEITPDDSYAVATWNDAGGTNIGAVIDLKAEPPVPGRTGSFNAPPEKRLTR
jgi:hypothetical protein